MIPEICHLGKTAGAVRQLDEDEARLLMPVVPRLSPEYPGGTAIGRAGLDADSRGLLGQVRHRVDLSYRI